MALSKHYCSATALALVILAGLLLAVTACRETSEPEVLATALKIHIVEDGLYALDRLELARAGLVRDAFSPEALSLTQGGEATPFLIWDDRLVFYGQGPDSRYTAARVYILRSGIAGVPIAPAPAPADTGIRTETVRQSLHLEENRLYAGDLPGIESGGPWFWSVLHDREEVTFDLPQVADGSGVLRVNLYGTTHNPDVEPDHSLSLAVNGVTMDEIAWEGQSYYTSTTTLPAGALVAGPNTVTLENIPEAYLDFSNLNWIDLSYQSPPVVHDDHIAITDMEGTVNLTGFSGTPLVLDVTEVRQPVQLTGWEYRDGALSLTLQKALTVVAVGPSGLRAPADVTLLRDSDIWRDTANQADLLIVTTDALLPGLRALIEAREAEGLTVAAVPVDEIYDQFGEGEAGPDSIREFVRYTHEMWAAPAPRYLLLVGEATTDFRGYLASRPKDPIKSPVNIVPSYLVPVTFGGETVSDARLVDLDDDLRPDLAVGRWPVDTRAEVEQLAARTLAYEAGKASRQALFAADGTSLEFVDMIERLIAASEFPRQQAELLNGVPANELAADWNQGAWLVTYTGHGSLQLWGKEEVFSIDSVNSIEGSGAPPIVVQLTCLSGLFAHPELTSLSESLLRHDGGPVLLIGATSLTYSFDQEPFAEKLLSALQDNRLERIGDVFQAAKADLPVTERDGVREVSDTFTLFGDPSARVLRPPKS